MKLSSLVWMSCLSWTAAVGWFNEEDASGPVHGVMAMSLNEVSAFQNQSITYNKSISFNDSMSFNASFDLNGNFSDVASQLASTGAKTNDAAATAVSGGNASFDLNRNFSDVASQLASTGAKTNDAAATAVSGGEFNLTHQRVELTPPVFAWDVAVAAAGNYSGALPAGAVAIAAHQLQEFDNVTSDQPTVIQLGQAATLNIKQALRVSDDAVLTINFNSSDNVGQSVASAAKLDIAGKLKLNGAGLFQFPANIDDLTLSQNASAVVSQNVGLSGNAGKLTIDIDDPNPSNRRCRVPFNQTFQLDGDIISSSGAADAVLEISGIFTSRGNKVLTHILLTSGGQFIVNSQTNGSAVARFDGGDLSLQSGSALRIQNGNGANTFFQNFSLCDAAAAINYIISVPFTEASSGTILNYSPQSQTQNNTCKITITDSTGAVITVTNPNSSNSASRRLLSQQATAQWGQQSLSYSSAASSQSQSSAVAHSTTTLLTVVGLVASLMLAW